MRSSRDKEVEAYLLRELAYEHGNEIYGFMKKYDIGESAYGRLMDAAAEGKSVMAHRLYGHHIIYDFPLDDLEKVPDFLEHILSDTFTRQGLPLLPGEILEDTFLFDYCKKISGGNWNFVNGFDVLLGTVSIYKGYNKFVKAMREIDSVDDFKDLANTFGVGALELAIAFSSANPFVFIGAVLHLTSGIRGFLNDGTMIYFNKRLDLLSVEFSIDNLSVDKQLSALERDRSIETLSLDYSLDSLILDE